jgi:hypothetical protein
VTQALFAAFIPLLVYSADRKVGKTRMIEDRTMFNFVSTNEFRMIFGKRRIITTRLFLINRIKRKPHASVGCFETGMQYADKGSIIADTAKDGVV